ncbi:unnamed protein product [Menidia menidia]|uniref:(Atlantic silverside) hypothetical protein n=1 Tax=Menidia menidia TaxID=238744 RepID=A0A8S4BE05_9TELE|nr:unnamed protein product [Menidia menidia]
MKGIFESYVKNVHWKNETGLFTITDLQKNNSGDYKLEWGSIFKFLYWLRVFDPVPTPKVSRLNSSSDSCLLLCSVGENITLQWLKGQQILNQSSSASSLRLSVDKQDFNSSFSCVASSPAENKTVTTSCALNQTKNDPVPTPEVSRLNSSSDSCLLLCSVGENITLQWLKGQQILNQSSSASSLLLSVDTQDFNSSFSCVASSLAENKTVNTSCALNQTKNDSVGHKEVQYTQIQMSDMSKVGNGSGSSGPEDGSDVTTV